MNSTVLEKMFVNVPDDFPFLRYEELMTDIRSVLSTNHPCREV